MHDLPTFGSACSCNTSCLSSHTIISTIWSGNEHHLLSSLLTDGSFWRSTAQCLPRWTASGAILLNCHRRIASNTGIADGSLCRWNWPEPARIKSQLSQGCYHPSAKAQLYRLLRGILDLQQCTEEVMAVRVNTLLRGKTGRDVLEAVRTRDIRMRDATTPRIGTGSIGYMSSSLAICLHVRIAACTWAAVTVYSHTLGVVTVGLSSN